ncbi:hypothetical protein [Sporichthya polymorpha]|uniref:hypothetical protein n=1 Tax=Sporichthya polymorpha TaxID=35751 RepID=UPI00036E00F0|nr:hypothetical protein [Sporichthya polymorpha]
MGHWSILSSLDQMEGRTYVVPRPFREAISATGYALQEPGRVLVEWSPEGGYVARTIKHTPGWAFLIPILLPFVRRTKTARLEFAEVEGGTAVTIHGAVDTKAAMRLRAFTTGVPVPA